MKKPRRPLNGSHPNRVDVEYVRSDLSFSLTSQAESNELSIANSGLTPLSPEPRWSVHPDSFNLDKLKSEALSLYGRDQELDVLTNSLEGLSSGVFERCLILISGESGTGKSALAHSLKTPTTKLNGLFIRGKFDFSNRNEPYSGIVLACDEICAHISRLQGNNLVLFHKVTQRIKQELGSELSLLIKFIPALMRAIDFKDKDPSSLIIGYSSDREKDRFLFSFQSLMRILSDEFAPLILVLDDLQWADSSSLDLLDVCLSDSVIKKFLIIGTHRSSEVDQSHILHHSIAGFRAKCESAVFEMTQLSIENLDVNAVNKIIGVLLSMDNEALTMGLAHVCVKRTQGNPFFVIQFLHMLHNNGLLTYDYASFSWRWNNIEIECSASATSNVVDLLKAKMSFLPKYVLEIMKIAACLGSTFNEMCLRVIFENSSSVPSFGEGEDVDAVKSGLEYLEQHGYIVRHCISSSPRTSQNSSASVLSSQAFSWTHDKILEAALLLIPTKEQAGFFREAGNIMLSRLDTASRESIIFILANLLNAGEELVNSDEKQLILARLNHDASLRALSISAFRSVANYAGNGIKLLPRNHWNDHYELSLSLYSVAAQAQGFLGNTDLMEKYCGAVLSQTEKPLRDKMWVYHTLANSLIYKGQTDEAANLLFNILAMCKCQFPKNPVSIAAGLIQLSSKIKSIMKSFNPEKLTESNNPMTLELMRLMDRLAQCLYRKKDVRLPLVAVRMLDYTVNHGSTAYSSVAFAYIGLLLTGFLNDFNGGAWFGENALKLIEKSQSSTTSSSTRFTVWAMVFPWTKATTQVLKPLLQSYNEGLKSGDKESACYSVYFWLVVRFIIGNPLMHLVKDMHLYSAQFKDSSLKVQSALMCMSYQAVLNIMGHAGNYTELIGDAVSEEDYPVWRQDFLISPMLFFWEGVLSAYFGEHVRHAITTIKYGHDYLRKRYPSACYVPIDTFLKGVSCFAAARETGKLKFSKVGEKLRSKIKRWREMGNPNVIHYESFLDAESAALKKKKDEAIMYYEKAIVFAGRTGFLQDMALACERLAEFHLVLGDEKEASYRLGQSVAYWREWGATAKVEDLEKKYGNLFHTSLSDVPVLMETEAQRQAENQSSAP